MDYDIFGCLFTNDLKHYRIDYIDDKFSYIEICEQEYIEVLYYTDIYFEIKDKYDYQKNNHYNITEKWFDTLRCEYYYEGDFLWNEHSYIVDFDGELNVVKRHHTGENFYQTHTIRNMDFFKYKYEHLNLEYIEKL